MTHPPRCGNRTGSSFNAENFRRGDRMKPSFLPGTPLLGGADVEQKRQQILDYFHATFDRYSFSKR